MSAASQMSVFDTHKAVKALCHAGFGNSQAEAVVEQINGAVNENVATKFDLERFATKEDLQRFATKEDLAELRDEVRRCATKEELAELRDEVRRCATKEDLQQFATKEDLARLEARISGAMLKYGFGIAALVVTLIKLLDFVTS